jgi:hypothetical protein
MKKILSSSLAMFTTLAALITYIECLERNEEENERVEKIKSKRKQKATSKFQSQ